MTAQILKNDAMHTTPRDPEFMVRWLSGKLTEEELSSLRNRDEYEAMVSANKTAKKALVEPLAQPNNVQPIMLESTETLVAEEVKTNAFPTFVALAMASLLLAMVFIAKLLIGTL